MKDRLADIIGDGREAFARLAPEVRADLVAIHGGIRAARAHAWAALSEVSRLDLVRDHGAVPVSCGDDIAPSPARGPVRVFSATALYPKGADGWEAKPAGHLGRQTMQIADAFDRMRVQSRRAGATEDGPLGPSQVAMGRHYATLAQRVAAGGLRSISLETAAGGGGTPEGYTDHRLDLVRRLDRLRRRIGPGTAMEVRRIRPSRRGEGTARLGIPDLQLVDAVCLDDLTVSEVLKKYGWSDRGANIKAATRALAAALDRMIGPPRSIQIVTWRGAGPQDGGLTA